MQQKRERFGTVAARMGFVTERDVEEALHFQRQLASRGEKHKLIGIIMLEMGMLGTTELIRTLQEMQPAAAAVSHRS